VDKKLILQNLVSDLQAAKIDLERSYLSQKEEAANAPGAMQSHSDTSRYQANVIADRIRAEIDVLDKATRSLTEKVSNPNSEKDHIGTLYILSRHGGKAAYIIVPEGAGGRKVLCSESEVFSVSPESPIGRELISIKRKSQNPLPVKWRETEVVDIL